MIDPWAALFAAPPAARPLAAAAMRIAARSEAGYRRSVYRVAAPHRRRPGVAAMPETWWRTAPVVCVRRLGLALELDLRDNLQRVLYFTGTYEPAVLALLARELGPGDVLVDVGAHVGVHALTAARRGVRTIAFEPAADSAAKLRRAAARNALDVAVVEAALGAEPGELELRARAGYEPEDAGVRSRTGTGEVVQRAAVVRFDDWASDVALDRLDAVKVDVEGDEALALEGMRESLARLRPRVLVVEVKPEVTDAGAVAVRRVLAGCGYAPAGIVLPFANEVYRPLPRLH